LAIVVLGLAPPLPANARTQADLLLDSWGDGTVVQVIQERDRAVSVSGRWHRHVRPAAMGQHHRSTSQRGATITLRVNASAVAVIGPRSPGRGKADVYVDGRYVTTIDAHAPRVVHRQVLFSRVWRETGEHSVTLKVVGTPGHPRISIDAFIAKAGNAGKARGHQPAPTATPGQPPAEPTPAGGPPEATPTPVPAAPTITPEPTAAPTAPAPPGPTPTAPPASTPPSPRPAPTATPPPAATPTPPPAASPTPATTCGTSLQAKVDAAPSGGTLNLGGCTYAAGATINKPLTLVGAQVYPPANTRGLIVTASGVSIDSVVIVGPQSATYRWNEVGILTTGSISNLVVRNSTLRRFGNSGIWLGPTTNARITGNTIEDAVYAGIMDIAGSGDRIDGNTVRRIGVVGASANGNNAYGIAISNEGGTLSSDVLVDGNTVETVPTWHALDTHAGQRITFSNNTVSGSPRALFITSDGAGRQARSITVTGNTLVGPQRAPDPVAITTYAAAGVTVTSNVARGWGAGNFFHDYQGLSTGLSVSGNSVTP
jgi:hypothetical protein